MPSHQVTFKRIKALSYITESYKSIHLIPEDSQTWNDWVFEICDLFECSKRTALEYMYTARSRVKRLAEQRENERLIQEEAKVDTPVTPVTDELKEVLELSKPYE